MGVRRSNIREWHIYSATKETYPPTLTPKMRIGSEAKTVVASKSAAGNGTKDLEERVLERLSLRSFLPLLLRTVVASPFFFFSISVLVCGGRAWVELNSRPAQQQKRVL